MGLLDLYFPPALCNRADIGTLMISKMALHGWPIAACINSLFVELLSRKSPVPVLLDVNECLDESSCDLKQSNCANTAGSYTCNCTGAYNQGGNSMCIGKLQHHLPHSRHLPDPIVCISGIAKMQKAPKASFTGSITTTVELTFQGYFSRVLQ